MKGRFTLAILALLVVLGCVLRSRQTNFRGEFFSAVTCVRPNEGAPSVPLGYYEHLAAAGKRVPYAACDADHH